MLMDVRNWDEDAYRESILNDRESHCRTVFRSIFAPSLNPNTNPDIIVTASSDGTVASYSLSSAISHLEKSCTNPTPRQVLEAEPRWFLQAHQGPAYDVKFYGEGPDSLLLSCGDDGQVRGWKWKELEESETPIHEQGLHVNSVVQFMNPQHRGPWSAMSPVPENNAIAVDSKRGSVFVAAGDSCAYCWDVETSKVKMVYKGHSDYLHCIFARRSSNQIITGSEDGTARIWDCGSGKCIQVIHPARDNSLKEVSSVSCIALDASESWLACGSGHNLFVWNLLASAQISRISAPTSCQDIVFDDNNILLVGASPILSRMDMSGKILSQIKCAPESAFSVSLHQPGIVAVAGYGGLVDVISQFGSHLCTFHCT
ncbi:THO complex subunit 6 [Silene latifolia]|uniref:THO complex subunit 6 n=1 Tax=Silene latifolia TaxID=37657 RepID=UPI003D775B4A